MARRPLTQAGADAVDTTTDGQVDGRRARSERTSLRVLAASRVLFIEHGYARTSVEAIAARAGVSAQTIYNQFGTKSELLSGVLDLAVAGDTDPVAVIERPWFFTGDGDSAADAVTRLASAGSAILARVAPVYDVIRSASSLPEVALLLADNRRRRRADQRHLVKALAAAGWLRPGLDAGKAADIVYGLVNEDVYLLLTVDCRWSRKQFSSWLAQTLFDQLARRS
jgi:AcrR family transcriptional regulator